MKISDQGKMVGRQQMEWKEMSKSLLCAVVLFALTMTGKTKIKINIFSKRRLLCLIYFYKKNKEASQR